MECLANHRRVIGIDDSRGAGGVSGAGRIHATGVGGSWNHDAVGGGDDGATKGREFRPLFLPGSAVLPGEIGMIVQLGIHVGGEHFAVGVDLDGSTFTGPEEVPKVEQIMAGDDDAGCGVCVLEDFGGRGLAELFDVALVQQLHDAEIFLPQFHGDFKERGDVEVDVGHGGKQRFFEEG